MLIDNNTPFEVKLILFAVCVDACVLFLVYLYTLITVLVVDQNVQVMSNCQMMS